MQGWVTSGDGKAAHFIPAVENEIASITGFVPYPGTLNLRGVSIPEELSIHRVDDPTVAMENCDGIQVRQCAISGVRAAILTPIVDEYPPTKTETVAPVHLRSLFDLENNDPVELSRPGELWQPTGLPVVPSKLEEFDAIVFDLDGTLVDLAVNWERVRHELRELFVEDPFGPDIDVSVGTFARERGRYEEFLTILETHETEGAKEATDRPLLSFLDKFDCPVGVCTKNAERAATLALNRFDALEPVDVLVARETTIEQKPNPAPLLACLDRLGANPGDSVFIGDERDDCDAAHQAGTNFIHRQQLSH